MTDFAKQNDLAERRHHIRHILSDSELKTLCFDYGLRLHRTGLSFPTNRIQIIEELIDHIHENDLGNQLIKDEELTESIRGTYGSETTERIQLQYLMVNEVSNDAILEWIRGMPWGNWAKELQHLNDRDFCREVILESSRLGYTQDLLESLLTEQQMLSLKRNPFIPIVADEVSTAQQDKLFHWMREDASDQDLKQLAFLAFNGVWLASEKRDVILDTLIPYFGKRNRVYQLWHAKNLMDRIFPAG